MSANIVVCEPDPDLKEEIQKFRMRKNETSAALIMKIDKDKLLVKLDEILEDVDIDEVRENIPSHQPRYIIYRSKLDHKDGRVSYPISFIFTSPQDCKPELQMMYAGSKLSLISGYAFTKVLEVRDVEELTQEWYLEKLLGKN